MAIARFKLNSKFPHMLTKRYLVFEETGEFIWNNSPDCIRDRGDFQNVPMWRDFNYQMLKYMNEKYNGTIIVSMTLVNKRYYNQIIGRLITEGVSVHHYILVAEKNTILSRLLQRGELDNSWAAQHIDRCLSSFEKDIIDIKINTNNLSVKEIVEFILKRSDRNNNTKIE